MTLKDLILESGGLSESVYRYQVEIARIDTLNKDLNQYAEIINLNMDENSNSGLILRLVALKQIIQQNWTICFESI